jgi:hypothetical protein
MQSGGEEAYECRVRWTELRGRGRAPASASPRSRTILGEWVTSPLDPVAASIGLKILGRGKLSLHALPSAQQASSAPPPTQSPPTCILLFSSIYTPHCVVALPCDCNSISSTAYVYIACLHLAFHPLQLHAWKWML